MTVLELVELLEVIPEQDAEISLVIGDEMLGYSIESIGMARGIDREGNELPTTLVLKG